MKFKLIKVNKFAKQKGFTLVELILTLSVIASISFMAFQSLNKQYEDNMASASGQQIKDVGMAVNNYIVNHYDVLSKLQNATGAASDQGPRNCSSGTGICVITTETLAKEGLLPSSFNGKNVYGSGYQISLKRTGTSPYWNVTGLITTDTPLMLGSKNGVPRYDLLGVAMQKAGTDSGMSRNSAYQIDGYKGTWNAKANDYPNINKLGVLGFQAGYGSNSYSAFLRRDGTLPMTGDLNMGTKNIYGAANITASGKGTFGGEVEAGSWVHSRNGYGDTMSIGGDAAGNDYEIRISNPNRPITVYSASGTTKMTVTGTLTAGENLVSNDQLNVKNNGSFGGKIGTNGLNPNDLPSGWGGGIRTWDVFANGTLAIKQAGATNNNQLAFSANNAGEVRASGNITAGKELIAHNGYGDSIALGGDNYNNDYELRLSDANKKLTIWSPNGRAKVSTTGRMTTGEYVEIESISVAGQWCEKNGLISMDNTGGVLSCKANKWASIDQGPYSRIAVNNLSTTAPNTFKYVLVTISSKFSGKDGSHTRFTNYNVYVNGALIGNIYNSQNVRKGGSRGHSWVYEGYAVAQKSFYYPVPVGANVSVNLVNSAYHITSDVRVDLVN